jgi:alkylation response protein AidB-like acyl-CoA dehydrogenase
MDLSYGAAAEDFRSEVRAFLKAEWTPDPAFRGAELKTFVRAFRLKATERGFLYRAIPKQYGGSEQPVDVIKAQVIREEFGRARAPMEIAGNGMSMTVPTLLEAGTQAQRDLFIAKTMTGEYIWGQG